ncbi:molybdate ABC transporter substrate-binding protein [Luteococcus sanguinis]
MAALALALTSVLTGCSGSASPNSTITVLAAASLSDTFDTLAADYEQAHPSVDVQVSYGGSSALAQQVNDGYPADVLASASTKTMDTVVASGKATTPTTFATNVLEVAVPKDNPGGVRALADLTKPDLQIALCQSSVPCGAASATLLTRQNLTVRAATEEADVRSVLTKVRLGEVDAGLVYATDVRAAGDDVIGIEIPPNQNVSTSYPIATLTGAQNPDGAAAFMGEVLSDHGRAVLREAGFTLP